MRLLYAYFDDNNDGREDVGVCGPLRAVNLNFDSGIKFSFDGLRSINVDVGKALSKCFFSYRGTDNISISAIIGENGTGKTSFSRLMYLWAKGEGCRAILIAEVDSKYITWHKGYKFLQFVGDMTSDVDLLRQLNESIEEAENTKLNEYYFKFIYYSPYYNALHQIQTVEPFFIDVSTSNLINNEGVVRYKGEEAKNVWTFLLANQIDIRKKDFEARDVKDAHSSRCERPFMPMIQGVSVSICRDRFDEIGEKYKEAFADFERDMQGAQTRVIRYDPVRQEQTKLDRKEMFCKDVLELYASADKIKAFFPRAFLVWQILGWHDRGAGLNRDPSGSDEIMMRFCKEHLMRPISSKPDVDKFRRNVMALIGGSMNMSASQFDALQEFSQCMLLFESPDTVPRYDRPLRFDFQVNDKRYGSFITLVGAHAKLKTIEDFLVISCDPPVSSGEWSYLAMLSRLYNQIKSTGDKPIVLFLDEIETTLHPLWQRGLVKVLIQFFETFFPSVAVHIVFASHSPMLLSDIPKSNVVFLMKDRGRYSIAEMNEDLGRLSNTFGANICDLYESGYFLDEGPIGAFALDKIKQTVEHISAPQMGVEDVVDCIGDPVIRHYIQRKLDAKTGTTANCRRTGLYGPVRLQLQQF